MFLMEMLINMHHAKRKIKVTKA